MFMVCFILQRSHCQSPDHCFQPGSLGSAVLPQQWHWQLPPRWPFPTGQQAPLFWQGPLPLTGADGSINTDSFSVTQFINIDLMQTSTNNSTIIIK